MKKPRYNWHQDRLQIGELLEGKKIRVYRNLHRHCLSVQHKGIVIMHVDEIQLKDTRFIVSQAGRERVLRERRKTVHAYVEGQFSNMLRQAPQKRCTYNPYKYSSFVTREDERPVRSARQAHVSPDGILIS